MFNKIQITITTSFVREDTARENRSEMRAILKVIISPWQSRLLQNERRFTLVNINCEAINLKTIQMTLNQYHFLSLLIQYFSSLANEPKIFLPNLHNFANYCNITRSYFLLHHYHKQTINR